MRFAPFVLLPIIAAFASAQTLDPNEVIVTINGEKILASEYFNRMEMLENVGTMSDGKFVELPPAFLTLQRIVTERLIMQVAKEKGVAPTPAEIDAEFKEQQIEQAESFKRLKDYGLTDQELKKRVEMDLTQFKLITMGVNITDEQVTNHYNLNKMVYVTPATVKLRVIVVDKPEDRAKVDEALKTKTFAEVAKQLSTDITKYDGGDLPKVAINAIPQNVQNEVLRSKAGDKTQWIQSEGSFLKYLIEAKEEQKQIPLDTKLRKEIKRRMMLVAGRQKNDVQAMIDDKRKSAKVQIGTPGLQKLWDAYMADYLRYKK